MLRTIFYILVKEKPSEFNQNEDLYYHNGAQYKKFKVLENHLYDINSSMETLDENGQVKKLMAFGQVDRFTENYIVRRIFLS